jgi:16S rRNA (guanine527-N7)-methyltransferase
VRIRATGRCEYCQHPDSFASGPFACEHVVPRAAGGGDEASDLAWSCAGCNAYKADKTQALDPISRRVVPLFNPRLHDWKRHFRWSADLLLVLGRTATGRATVDALRLNREELVSLRSALKLAGGQVETFPTAADAGLQEAAVLADSLSAALSRHGLALDPQQVELLDKYCRLLWSWNEKLNLTRHTDYEKFVSRDLVDSLQLVPHLRQNEEVLDVGTGGGVPGVVLAILRPDLKVTLCDSVGKKARAVETIVKDLGLEIPVFPFRAEELLEDTRYDALVIRAVGPLWKLLSGFKPHWHSFRRMLVIKGPKWTEELTEARRRGLMNSLQLKTAAEYPMAGADGKSVLLKIWPKNHPER